MDFPYFFQNNLIWKLMRVRLVFLNCSAVFYKRSFLSSFLPLLLLSVFLSVAVFLLLSLELCALNGTDLTFCSPEIIFFCWKLFLFRSFNTQKIWCRKWRNFAKIPIIKLLLQTYLIWALTLMLIFQNISRLRNLSLSLLHYFSW